MPDRLIIPSDEYAVLRAAGWSVPAIARLVRIRQRHRRSHASPWLRLLFLRFCVKTGRFHEGGRCR